MIEKEEIEHIKSTVDMVALAETKGVRMKKNGKSYFGLCPFHNDKDPSFSITPSKNEWHCFGCDKGGDVIRFVELFDQVDFKEAVARLAEVRGQRPEGGRQKAEKKPADQDKPLSYDPRKEQYLERAVDIYEKNFVEKEAGKAYLNSRRIRDGGLFTKYSVGFCDGGLNDILPQNGDVRESLKQVGILLDDGSERFVNCVVFPVYDMDGRLVTLYGRCMDDESRKKHLFLPERPTGFWNGSIIKTCSEIILTEPNRS